MAEVTFTVSEFIEVCNQSLDYSFPGIIVEGEVASFKVNQGKWVFFDLKEGDSTVSCFMVLSQLTSAIADGMKIRVRATPKLTRWGRFSLTVRQVMPVGEGSIKKNFELLKKKLTAEGLFDPARKRPLPEHFTRIGVISSVDAAGYIDFLKILDNRWGGLEVKTINTQVQGLAAPEQIIRAIQYFNEKSNVEIIAILRGGGSATDLAAFNDEQLARTIASSKIPIITGIGHEIDESLADLAADIRASTPSNAAERLTPDRIAISYQVKQRLSDAKHIIIERIDHLHQDNSQTIMQLKQEIIRKIDLQSQSLKETQRILASLNPEAVLHRGYAILNSKSTVYQTGDVVKITTFSQNLTVEVKDVQNRKN